MFSSCCFFFNQNKPLILSSSKLLFNLFLPNKKTKTKMMLSFWAARS